MVELYQSCDIIQGMDIPTYVRQNVSPEVNIVSMNRRVGKAEAALRSCRFVATQFAIAFMACGEVIIATETSTTHPELFDEHNKSHIEEDMWGITGDLFTIRNYDAKFVRLDRGFMGSREAEEVVKEKGYVLWE